MSNPTTINPKTTKNESLRPPGVFLVSIGIPSVMYALHYGCRGQPVLWKSVWQDLWDTEAALMYFGWYAFCVVAWRVLPGAQVEGTRIRDGTVKKYKINALSTLLFMLGLVIGAIIRYGPAKFTFLFERWVGFVTASTLMSILQASFVYIMSFRPNALLSFAGNSGNSIYDWYFGRELNPSISVFGAELDIKTFNQLRPGLILWVLIDISIVCEQAVRRGGFGGVTDSLLLVSLFQFGYVAYVLYDEPAILTTRNVTSDGFGFVLSVGNIAWVPFVYSLQAYSLVLRPCTIGLVPIVLILAVAIAAYYLFHKVMIQINLLRGENAQGIPHNLRRPITVDIWLVASFETSELPQNPESLPGSEVFNLPASGSGNTIILDEETQQHVLENILTLAAIVEISYNGSRLEDPMRAAELIIPSLHVQDPSTDGYRRITFRGRTIFQTKILPVMNQVDRRNHWISGTYGFGINYLVTGAAVALMSENKPVAFLQCQADTRILHIRDAILLAMSKVPNAFNQWAPQLFRNCVDGIMGLRRVTDSMARHLNPLIFIILDVDLLAEETYKDLLNLVGAHTCYFTINPNSPRHPDFLIKGKRDFTYHFGGALLKEELDGWWCQYQNEIASGVNIDQYRTAILSCTNAIPSLLENAVQTIKITGLWDPNSSIKKSGGVYHRFEVYYQQLLSSSSERHREVHDIILAAITDTVCIHNPWYPRTLMLVDREFFYQDHKLHRHWKCAGPLVSRAACVYSLTLQATMHQKRVISWLNLMTLVSSNPVMVGFIAEYAASSVVTSDGLRIRIKATPSTTRVLDFPANLRVTVLMSRTEIQVLSTESQIFIPAHFNYPNIDFAVIAFGTHTVKICAIQVTTVTRTTDHSNSSGRFFQEDWRMWREAVTSLVPGREIEWSFLWIIRTSNTPNCTHHPSSSNSPAYDEWVVDFRSIDHGLADALDQVYTRRQSGHAL
ncbi:hypothetical protein D9757_004546 [Collybiopsis confluens]|uniref:Uncharacterized protein n=1 Tax=Collybiopsis confluens TaxID=2823264 RepID=A0A8H5MDT4_9AGAR|nr:hypothetical protein D9757_004546 [Collybiopsis confluens]